MKLQMQWTVACSSIILLFAIVAALHSPWMTQVMSWQTSTSATASESSVESSTLNAQNEAKHWTQHFNFNLAQSQSSNLGWGSFRPYVYFGMRTKSTPYSLSTGLLWYGARGVDGLRDTTSQGELTKFEWLEHDGKGYGLESLIDGDNRLYINASFFIPEHQQPSAISEPRSVWSQRIIARPDTEAADGVGAAPPSLVLYVGVEGSDTSLLGVRNMLHDTGMRIAQVISHPSEGAALTVLGISKTMGSISVTVTARSEDCRADPLNTCALANLCYNGMGMVDVTHGVERLKQMLHSRVIEATAPSAIISPNILEVDSAFIALQATGPSSTSSLVLDVIMRQHGSDSVEAMGLWASSGSHVQRQSEQIDSWLHQASTDFHAKFANTFHLETKSIADAASDPLAGLRSTAFTPQDVSAAKAALSSLLGGMGFFYGTPRIGDALDGSDSADDALAQIGSTPYMTHAEPIRLLSATPSRTAFPRGFLWDEGFHQMLIGHWDSSITTEVLAYWLDAMYKCDVSECIGGWIPREMILGDAAVRRVPDEFITQRVNIANPPTLLLAIDSLLRRYGNKDIARTHDEEEQRIAALNFLVDAHPALHQWVQWFLSSQRGHSASFRWRGRSMHDQKVLPNTLASGLDDYPRSPIPHDSERHLDLHCWMTLACKIMAQLKILVSEHKFAGSAIADPQKELKRKLYRADALNFDYEGNTVALMAALDELHWSEKMQTYADVGLAGSQDQLRSEVVFRCVSPTEPQKMVDISVPVDVVKSGAPFCPESHPKPLFPHGDGNGGVQIREKYVVAGDVALQYIPRMGYVNLFPLLTKLLDPQSPKLAAVLAALESPKLLWSDHGLRSLSTVDAFYRRNNAPGDAPYWR